MPDNTTPTQDAEFRPGTVTLVGAGPGDPELLTLKAVRDIRSATVLLVDDLVNDAVLAHASPTAAWCTWASAAAAKARPRPSSKSSW